MDHCVQGEHADFSIDMEGMYHITNPSNCPIRDFWPHLWKNSQFSHALISHLRIHKNRMEQILEIRVG